MNCCDDFGTCTRGHGCPAQGPAVVAPVKQSITRCQELGVCQSLTPCCSGCSITSSDEQAYALDRVTFYVVVGLASAATISWVVGTISFALHYFGWLTL